MITNAPQTACSPLKQSISLGCLRERSGLSYRALAERTSIPLPRVHRIVNGKCRPRRAEVVALRQAMLDVIRRLRSSDPDFLRRIQEVAVPFLEGRLRDRARARAGSRGGVR